MKRIAAQGGEIVLDRLWFQILKSNHEVMDF